MSRLHRAISATNMAATISAIDVKNINLQMKNIKKTFFIFIKKNI